LQQQHVVALDPGVRTFQTCYDPVRQQCIKWGDDDNKRIYRLCRRLDQLMSRSSAQNVRTMPHRRRWHRCRWKMRRAAARMRTRIRNLVDEMQRKLIRWLCESYRVILLPRFDTQRMISKRNGSRRIRSKTARAMATWAHYRFRTRLLNYARAYPLCHVEIVNEAYTSMTCGRCGTLYHQLGSQKVFACGQCGYRVDRDLNGARNIYLRYLTTSSGAAVRALSADVAIATSALGPTPALHTC